MKLLVIAAVGAATLASGAAAEPTVSAAKCPKGKAPVTITGKRTCRPMAAALPRPRAGDELVPSVSHALDPTWGETRDGPPTLEQLVGPETKRAIQQALPQAFARLGNLGKARFTSAAAALAGRCRVDQVLPVTSDSYSSDLGGGASMEAQMRTGPDGATMTVSLIVPRPGGRAVRISADLGLCSGEGLQTAACPTAQGVVEGTDDINGTIKVQELVNGSVESSTTTTVKIVTTLRGEVDEDAKLEFLKIDRTETYVTAIDYGRWLGVSQQATIRRTATIAMRTGAYLAGTGSVDIQQSFSGVLNFLVNETAARAAAIAAFQRASNQAWSNFVDEAMKAYRKRETAWQRPNTCARLEFAPRSNTLRVRVGQQGRATGTIRAERGGAPIGKWKVTARQRLGVRPGAGRGASHPFTWRVDGPGRVSVTFRVTSKAGVAQDKWEQGASNFPRRISGTFSGSTPGSVSVSWSGRITFVRDESLTGPDRVWYAVESVSYTSTYSVNEAGCTGQSTGSASLARQGQGSWLLLNTRAVQGRHAYEVQGQFQGPLVQITVTCHGFPTSQPWPPTAIFMTAPNAFSADERTWTFSGTNNVQGALTVTWNMRGTP